MQLISYSYAILFFAVFLLYYAFAPRFRWMLLLAASYLFYMSFKPELIVLLVFDTLVTYAAARLIAGSERSPRTKKCVLILGLVLPLAVLFFFKYFNFFSAEVSRLFSALSIPISAPVLELVLPIGISFYTFEALGYVIDVYRGTIESEKHLGYYALFLAYFPQLAAGPIGRAGSLIPQFRTGHAFDPESVVQGLRRIALGIFKKLAIADLIALRINPIFDNVTGFRGFPLLLSAVLFSIQLYCDFSGYTDIAIGCSEMLGFNLMSNFKSPYLAKSIKEFWRRWHISLSSWFGDYLYIPLGGSRVRLPRHILNLLITFAVSGLWHGASWNFVVWGLLHGVYSAVGVLFRKIRFPQPLRDFMSRPLPSACRVLFTFALVCIAWIFFRANTLQDAFYVLRYSLEGIGAPIRYVLKDIDAMNFRIDGLIKPLIGIAVLFFIDVVQLKEDPVVRFGRLPNVPRYVLSVLFVLMILLFSNKGIPSEFIYAQF